LREILRNIEEDFSLDEINKLQSLLGKIKQSKEHELRDSETLFKFSEDYLKMVKHTFSEKYLSSVKTTFTHLMKFFGEDCLLVTIKTKELDELIPRIYDVAAFSAYTALNKYVSRVPVSDSYSEINDLIGETLLASGSFIQIYEDNFFGKLDTLHLELIGHLNEFESIVSDIRRNTYSFTWAVDRFNENLNEIKSATSPTVVSDLKLIKSEMEELYIYASEGDTRTVFGIFQTEIMNHGKVYGRTAQKSWEDSE